MVKYKESMFNNYIRNQMNKIEVYNSFTKARIIIHDETFIKKILFLNETSALSDLQIKDFDSLRKNGFIVKQDLDEQNMLNYMFSKYYFNSNLKNIVLMPTLNCNFGCTYCFEKSTSNKFVENKNYFNAIKNYLKLEKENISNLHLSMFGGEPLLKKKEIFDLCEFVDKELNTYFRLDCSITTNGSLLQEEDIQLLRKFHCKYLQITLDGSKQQHNISRTFKSGKPSFDLLIEKLKLAANLTKHDSEFKVILRFNLLNNTPKEIEEILQEFDENIRPKINILFRAVFNTDCFDTKNSNSNSNIKEFYEVAKKMGFQILQNKRFFSYCESCGDLNTLHILPDLSLWKCINDLNFEKACIGKLNEDGKIIWNTENILNWYKHANFSLDEECKKCSLSADCLGGCILYKAKFGKKHCEEIHSLSDSYRYGK